MTDSNFDPFQAEPLVLRRLDRHKVPPGLLLFALPITFLLCTWVAAMEGMLLPESGWSGILHDFRAVFALRDASRPVGSFEFFRDLPSLTLLVTCSMSLYTSYANMDAMSRMKARLLTSQYHAAASTLEAEQGAGQDGTSAFQKVNAEISAANGRVASIGSRWKSYFVACLAVGGVFAWAQTRTGIHYYFQTGETATGRQLEDGYSAWWASWKPFRPGAVLWWLLGSAGLYLASVQAVVGWNFAVLLWRSRKFVRLDLNPLHYDGQGGWADINRALRTGYWSTLVFMASLTVVTYLLWPVVPIGILAVFVSICMLNNFVLIGSIFLVLYRSAAESQEARQSDIMAIAETLGNMSDSDTLLRRHLLAEESRRLREIPRAPSRGIVVLLGVVLLLLGIGANIAQIAQGL